jgi:hypothetical protein
VHQAHARAVKEEGLRGRPATADEDEERAGSRVVANAITRERCEAVEAAAQIDRLKRDEDLNADGNHPMAPWSAVTTAARSAGSKPGATRTRAAPISTTSSVERATTGLRGRSSMKVVAVVRRRRLDQPRSVLAA